MRTLPSDAENCVANAWAIQAMSPSQVEWRKLMTDCRENARKHPALSDLYVAGRARFLSIPSTSMRQMGRMLHSRVRLSACKEGPGGQPCIMEERSLHRHPDFAKATFKLLTQFEQSILPLRAS